jgi:hypothetical protein
VIRQTVSCDICGTEKQQTNRWFVAEDQDEELCISGWSSQKFLSPGAKHLCGHTCMHKLVDEFMDRKRADEQAACATNEVEIELNPMATDTSPTSETAYQPPQTVPFTSGTTSLISETALDELDEFESSARLVPTPSPAPPPTPIAPAQSPIPEPVELVTKPAQRRVVKATLPVDDVPRFASRDWRTEAWEREREREQRATGRHPESGSRRRFIS